MKVFVSTIHQTIPCRETVQKKFSSSWGPLEQQLNTFLVLYDYDELGKEASEHRSHRLTPLRSKGYSIKTVIHCFGMLLLSPQSTSSFLISQLWFSWFFTVDTFSKPVPKQFYQHDPISDLHIRIDHRSIYFVTQSQPRRSYHWQN